MGTFKFNVVFYGGRSICARVGSVFCKMGFQKVFFVNFSWRGEQRSMEVGKHVPVTFETMGCLGGSPETRHIVSKSV